MVPKRLGTADLGHPGLPEKEIFTSGGELLPYLVRLVAVSCNWQNVYSRWIYFQVYGCTIKSLMAGTYIIIVFRDTHLM